MHCSRLWFPFLLVGVSSAAVWQLPLPAGSAYTPLPDLPGWTVPGTFQDAEAGPTLRNTAARDVLSGHAVAGGAGLLRSDGALRVTVDVAGRTNTAVWVGIGADHLDPNGRLDGLECRLMLGFDRGRWGLRQGALGETVWAPASLPASAGRCRIEVAVQPQTGQLLSVAVLDALGRRSPASLAVFNPDWSALPAGAGTAWWQFARVETRGAQAELLGLAVGYTPPGVLIIR